MIKTFTLGLIVGIALLFVSGVGRVQSQGKNSELAQKQREIALFKAEVVDASPIQINVLSEKQRLHSKIYRGWAAPMEGKTISEFIVANKGKQIVYEIILNGRSFSEFTDSETPEEYFRKIAQFSDAVIRGRAVHKQSQISDDDTFLFTDYEVIVSEVLKNNTSTSMDSGKAITVTCPGGKIVVDDVVMKASGSSFPVLPLNSDVLLFLEYVPETGAYKLTRENRSFELDGSSVKAIAGRFPEGFIKNESSFMKLIRNAANQ